MDYFDLFVFIIEIISITSFAISGSVTAIKKGMDIFGVVILGVTTAIGGGVIRDIVLGINPPKTFTDPIYAIVSAVTSVITFIIEARHYKKAVSTEEIHGTRFTDAVMFWLDTLGLAIFTMVGVAVAYEQSSNYSAYLLCFVGVITGVGGGIMRDVFTGSMPYIFVKHIYASACVAGSIVCVLLWGYAGRIIAMITGAGVIILLRFLAAKFKWNLPKIQVK